MGYINIIIVDDQNLFRQSLAVLINQIDRFNLVGEFVGGGQLLDSLLHNNIKVDVALIDIDMPGITGNDLNKTLQKQYPNIKVIILSVHINEVLITQMIDSGAASYLAKNCDKDELLAAINSVYKKGFYFNAATHKAIKNSGNNKIHVLDAVKSLPIVLSDRDIKILQLICHEFNNVEIADKLCLSARTVEGYRIKLLNKINCRNTAGMVLFAIKHSILEISL